jgi:hypothetical protein
MPSLMDMEKKSVIIGGITGSIVGLFLLVLAAIAVSSASASNYNCIDIGQKLERRVARAARKRLDCLGHRKRWGRQHLSSLCTVFQSSAVKAD